MLPHRLNNFETQNYYRLGPKFFRIYSYNQSSLPRNGAYYLTNPDEDPRGKTN